MAQWQASGPSYKMQSQEIVGESNDVLLGCERDIEAGFDPQVVYLYFYAKKIKGYKSL